MKKFKRISALLFTALMLVSTFISYPAIALTAADTVVSGIQADGTVLAYFDFDDESNWTNGVNATATVNGNGIDFVDRDGGKAAVFNYTDKDWLDIKKKDNTALLTGYDNMSISYDVSFSETSHVNWVYYASDSDTAQGGTRQRYISSVIPNGVNYIVAERYNSTTRPTNAKTGALNANQWYHIDVVYTQNSTIIYVDGTQVSNVISNFKISDILGDNSVFQIGKGNWWTGSDFEYATMQLDNFKVVGYQSNEKELAYFDFENNNIKDGGNATATVNGNGISFVDHNGGKAAQFNYADKDWLKITKKDNSSFLLTKDDNSTVYDNITISYDVSYSDNSNTTWIYFAAPYEEAQEGNKESYICSVIPKAKNYIEAERYDNTGSRPTNATTEALGDLNVNQWYHIDVVYTDNATAIYVDGKQVGYVNSDYTLTEIFDANNKYSKNDNRIFQIGKGNWYSYTDNDYEYTTMQLDNFKVVGYETDPNMLADMLTLPYSTEKGKEVYGNITLPTSIDGFGNVTWTTTPSGIVTDKGIVTRPDTDTVVKATATITVNGNTTTKDFTFTVKAKSATINEEDYTDYFFAYFTGGSNYDEEQVYFATSQDGLNWKNINNNTPSLKSTLGKQGVRDPFIIRSPEGDKFYLLGTDAKHNVLGWGNFSTSIIVWESTDLINWTNQRLINVDPYSQFGCAWAPEAFYDDATNQYVVFWASYLKTDPNAGQDNTELMHFSIYYSTTRDFYTFSAPELYLSYDGSIIDTTMIKGIDNKIYRFTKNESTAAQTIKGKTIPPKSVFVEVGSSVLSNDFTVIESASLAQYSNVSDPVKPVEGPAIFKLNNDDARTSATDTTNTWCLLLDNFAGGGYFPLTTNTLSQANFTAVDSGKYSMPGAGYRPARHGTPIRITTAEYNAIMAAASKNTNTHAKFDIDAVNVLDNNANTILVYPKKFFDAKINAPGKNLNDMFTTLPDGFSWSDWTAFRIEKRGDETGGLRYTIIEAVNGANNGGLGVDKNDAFVLLVKNSYLKNNNISYSVTSDWPSLHSGNIYESDSDGLGDTAEIFINNNLYINDLNSDNSATDPKDVHSYVPGKPYGTVTFLQRNTFGIEAVNTLDSYASVNTIMVYPQYFKDQIENTYNGVKILRNMFPNPPQGFNWSDWSAIRIEQRGNDTDGYRYTVIEEGVPEGYVNGVYQQGGYIGVDKYESYILLVKNSYLSQNNIFLPTADWPNGDTNTDGNGDTATFTFLNKDSDTNADKYTSIVNDTLLLDAPSGYAEVTTYGTYTKYYGYVTFTPKAYDRRNGLNGEMGEKAADATPVTDPSIEFSLFDYDGKINFKPGTTDYTKVENQRTVADFFPFKSMWYGSLTNPELQNLFRGTGETPYDKWEFKEGHSTVNKTLLDGYPVLNLEHGMLEENKDGVIVKTPVSDTSLTDEQRSLAYLFGGTNNDPSVTKYTPKNTLLQKVGTHYTYDCNYNAVDYDTNENVFRLRNYTERIDATVKGDQTENCDFLPFNYTDGIISGTDQRYNSYPYAGQSYAYNVRTDKTDYWFGMRMDVDFIQGQGGKNENEEMEFKFSGDDDVWVFIDDVLVLDLGGTHGACTGTINFKTGAIEQYEQQFNKEKNSYPTTLKECFEAAGKTSIVKWNSDGTTFADYTEHTMSFFYMERGSGASYCNIDFNLPTRPDKSVAVSKDVVDTNGYNLNALDSTDYTFRIIDTSDNTPPTGEEAKYKIGSDIKSVDDYGQFTLKGGQTAFFTNLVSDTNYKIEEITDTTYQKYIASTTVSEDGGESTTGTSIIVTPSDTAKTVNFVNTLKSAPLTVESLIQCTNYNNLTSSQKKHYDSATSSKQTTYQITVTNANGNKLSSLSYKIGDSAAVSVAMKDGVGEFSLSKGAKALFDIPVDYKVTVKPKPDANTIERFDYNYSVAITNGGTTVSDQPQATELEKELAYVFTNTYTMQTTPLTINTNIFTNFTDGTKPEQGGTVLYRIKGASGDLLTENIDLQVVAKCNDDGTVDSVKINGLPVGEYTVTQEKAWIWRYTLRTVDSNVTNPTLANNTLSFTLPKQNGNYLTFNDEITYNKWVDGNSYVENKFS